MILLHKKTQTFIPLIFALIIVLLSFLGCENGNQPTSENNTEEKPTAVINLDSLPNKLKNLAAHRLIQNYRETKGDVDTDFFFGNTRDSLKKVIHFRLNQQQASELFQEYNNIKGSISKKDSIRLRIPVAFRIKGAGKGSKPNFFPMLNLMINKDSSDNYYTLRPFRSDQGIHISDTTARRLIKNWEKVPVDHITEELYLDNLNGTPGGRLKYYTFDASDTRDFFEYQKENCGESSQCYVSVHLGKLDQRDYIPLRTILRISDILITETRSPDDAGEDDWEFARPCPHYCD